MTDKPHMKLENGDKLFEGEYGITRNGERVGPIKPDAGRIYHWIASGEEYTGEGEYYSGGTTGADIIARAEPAISLEVLENLTTPLGLLDDATRKALEAHGGPYEWFAGDWRDTDTLSGDRITHRVKRQPKVETVKASVWVADDEFIAVGIAIDKINGEYDPSTVRPWVEGKQ